MERRKKTIDGVEYILLTDDEYAEAILLAKQELEYYKAGENEKESHKPWEGIQKETIDGVEYNLLTDEDYAEAIFLAKLYVECTELRKEEDYLTFEEFKRFGLRYLDK